MVMKRIVFIGFMFTLCFFVTACSVAANQNTPAESEPSTITSQITSNTQPSQNSAPQTEKESEPVNLPQPSVFTGSTFDETLALYGDNEIVRDNFMADPLENVALLDEWVENYRRGIPGRVVILLDSMGFPSGLYILESNGSATYTITTYSSAIPYGETEQRPPHIHESSLVIKRAYDYIFGADFPAIAYENLDDGHHRHPIVIHRHTIHDLFQPEHLEWSPDSSEPLLGITPYEAERRAEEVNERLSQYVSIIKGIYSGGVYMRESVLAAADRVSELYGDKYIKHFKTVGVMRLDGKTFYIVHGHHDLEALNRGEYGFNATAVSLDGRLVFQANDAHGGWYFVDDAEQEIIAP
jgi:hypothetical protein